MREADGGMFHNVSMAEEEKGSMRKDILVSCKSDSSALDEGVSVKSQQLSARKTHRTISIKHAIYFWR